MVNNWITIKQLNIETTHVNFWKCIGLLITKPVALNRNIGGCELLKIGLFSEHKVQEVKDCITKMLKDNIKEYSEVKDLLKSVLSLTSSSAKTTFVDIYSYKTYRKKNFMFLRLTFPRNGMFRMDIFDLICLECSKNCVTFTKLNNTNDNPRLLVDLPYAIKYSEGMLSLLVPFVKENDENLNFLKSNLFPKLSTWMGEDLKNDQIYSLNLVEIDKYVILYNELKKKYVNSIKEIWTECTNVEKFIHEDIGIATYLILLWGRKPQNFLDLGCGNGLLVYILNGEGHQGVGIDVRARKIWKKYPNSTILKEMPITPSDRTLFPDADWIIGNHCDELTPWIPVISFRSSYKTNFFLLPCCPYEFDGKKYSRNNSSKSQYQDYLDYIEVICKKCGFVTVQDRLCIPSTKRTCIVSVGKSFSESEQKQVDEEVIKLIRRQSVLSPDRSGKWLNYKPREAKEKVRNCTQLKKEVINEIITHIAKLLLKNPPELWNEGNPMKLSDIVHTIPTELLIQLKNENGGLQTLLRNHQHIFQFQDGEVKFKKPVERKVNEENWKKKHCWFFNNHPDSCPLPSDKCSFRHVKDDEIDQI